MTDRIQELEGLIRRYQASYYNGEEEVSDAEFDALWDELKALDPGNALLSAVGADAVDGFPKVRHLIPMGSQDKAANPEEFFAWVEKKGIHQYLVQHKLDGASLELQYEGGRLIRAVTRGDGIIGDEITRNARRMRGCVATLDVPFSGGVRCEVLMPHSVWHERYPEKANCRNAANGIMRRKDGEGCEFLDLVCYDASSSEDDDYFSDETAKLSWLKARGFSVVSSVTLSGAEEVVSYRARIMDTRESLPYDIDGLVVKAMDIDMADLRRARPERQIAFKFSLEEAITTLRSVAWSESGATYTPIGLVDPVRLAGTTVQRANLNNPAMIRSMGLMIGSRVVVVKRGEIIPKIECVVENPSGVSAIELPERCDTCGSDLVDGGTRLYCPNQDCPKRIHHRIEKWISVLDIREFGDTLLSRLFDSGRLKSVADLYSLTVEELGALDRMGELSAAKVHRNLRTSRELSLAAFVAGFDLEGVGETIMEKVVGAGFDTLESLRSASVEELAAVYGLGEITAKVIVDGLKEVAADMDATLNAGVISIAAPLPPESSPLRGLSFCFTGELSSMRRSAAEAQVKALGGLVKSSVVKDLSFLVTNDPSSGSGKNAKARKLAVAILDEDSFLGLLKDGPSALPSALSQAEPSSVRPSAEVSSVTVPVGASQGELFGEDAGA